MIKLFISRLAMAASATLALAAPMAAQAQAAGTWYLGGNVGQAKFDGGSDTAMRFLAGYNLGNLGSLPVPLSIEGNFSTYGKPFAGVKLSGFGVDLVAPWVVAPQLSVLARLGFHRASVKDEGFSDSDTGLKFGAGVQYQLNPRLGLRAEFERNMHDPDVDLFSVGAVYHF